MFHTSAVSGLKGGNAVLHLALKGFVGSIQFTLLEAKVLQKPSKAVYDSFMGSGRRSHAAHSNRLACVSHGTHNKKDRERGGGSSQETSRLTTDLNQWASSSFSLRKERERERWREKVRLCVAKRPIAPRKRERESHWVFCMV